MINVPNAITISRIVLTPVVLVLLFMDSFETRLGALVVFVIAAITDYYDGKLARSMKVGSRLGKFLDPLADKVLVLGTFIAFAVLIPEIVPWWSVALIAARDAFVTGLRTWYEAKGKSLRTMPLAKAKTTVQLVFLIGTLLLLTLSKMTGQIQEIGLWVLNSSIPWWSMMIVVAFTLVTGFVYLLNAFEASE
ncbi:MAG: CDP-diacylglycerol--glycerol-3-phosphate 3-phosphatidyltransferase [Rhodothermales bacterium]